MKGSVAPYKYIYENGQATSTAGSRPCDKYPQCWTHDSVTHSVYDKQVVCSECRVSNVGLGRCFGGCRLNDGWAQLQNEFRTELRIIELKERKESLMSAYRSLKKKLVQSEVSGQGNTDVYKPSWIAYGALDKFLDVTTSHKRLDQTLFAMLDALSGGTVWPTSPP
nr:unnamed protein product [Callosobruchus analis]